jgi:hypothetical protein
MEQVNDTMLLSPPSRTWEALVVVEYNAGASDIAAGERRVGASVLQQIELPSRRWLIEASRPENRTYKQDHSGVGSVPASVTVAGQQQGNSQTGSGNAQERAQGSGATAGAVRL